MPENHPEQFEKLCELSTRAHTLQGISSLLSWDQETYMPEMASPIRAKQCELLAELAHDIKTSSEFEKTLNRVIDIASGDIKEKGLTAPQEAAAKVYRRDFVRDRKLPTAFVQEFALVTSEAIPVWQKAKIGNDFASFEPTLEKIISLVRKKADFLGYDKHPYDALLEEYEPGCTTAQIGDIFEKVQEKLTALLKHISEKPTIGDFDIPAPESEQMEICQLLLGHIGYDFKRGRIDISSHPFSSSYHPYDSRITTRAESHGIVSQILTTLHEAGHSFYDMGRSVAAQGTPLGDPISHGIHESQSRLWETRIGRSLPFWQFFYPLLQKRFPQALVGISIDDFYKKINIVKPTLIRTDADEVTYPLHVILRFEIEKELTSGALKVKELPDRWRAGMKKLLMVEPKNDTEGCLQDIHWSMGAFGYFPTYSLGNIYAAQLFETFAKDHPDWESNVRNGQFAFIKEWLSDAVWQHGRRYNGEELIRKVTGKVLTHEPFINYLTAKYSTPN
ncbi:MAG: carboxypeptidase M32 [Verrucomicrobia bacterium]|nr:carboxypeptidase M32 [Verrucomicrobiota bacterium]